MQKAGRLKLALEDDCFMIGKSSSECSARTHHFNQPCTLVNSILIILRVALNEIVVSAINRVVIN